MKVLKDSICSRSEHMSIEEWNDWVEQNDYPSLRWNPEYWERVAELEEEYALNQAFNTGFDKGYKKGYMQGYMDAISGLDNKFVHCLFNS